MNIAAEHVARAARHGVVADRRIDHDEGARREDAQTTTRARRLALDGVGVHRRLVQGEGPRAEDPAAARIAAAHRVLPNHAALEVERAFIVDAATELGGAARDPEPDERNLAREDRDGRTFTARVDERLCAVVIPEGREREVAIDRQSFAILAGLDCDARTARLVDRGLNRRERPRHAAPSGRTIRAAFVMVVGIAVVAHLGKLHVPVAACGGAATRGAGVMVVGIAVVARFPAFRLEDAVAAMQNLAGRRAAVATPRVAVVALFAGPCLHDANASARPPARIGAGIVVDVVAVVALLGLRIEDAVAAGPTSGRVQPTRHGIAHRGAVHLLASRDRLAGGVEHQHRLARLAPRDAPVTADDDAAVVRARIVVVVVAVVALLPWPAKPVTAVGLRSFAFRCSGA